MSETLDRVPAVLRVLRTIRPKYACRASESAVVQAPAPAKLIEGSMVSTALVAHIAVAKYGYAGQPGANWCPVASPPPDHGGGPKNQKASQSRESRPFAKRHAATACRFVHLFPGGWPSWLVAPKNRLGPLRLRQGDVIHQTLSRSGQPPIRRVTW